MSVFGWAPVLRRDRSGRGVVAAVAIVAALVFAAPAMATTRNVANGGIDNPGCAAPCEHINFAIGEAVAGDIISVAAGTYDEAVVVDKRVSLVGAQAGVDARTRSVPASQESIVQQGFDVQTGGAS